MSKEAFERKLAQVESLRTAQESDAVPQLRRALKDRSNYLVSKAAAIVGDRRFAQITPDLVEAFQRFLHDAVKSDPQCWAKNALVKALKDLDYAEPEVFLLGIVHGQMEPVWGRREDTAATLRGACAMGLIGCVMDSFDILTRLTDLLSDPETPARIDAARAIAQLSAKEGALPLRLKARLGDPEPEVVGHCLAALLSLNPSEYLPFVGDFLRHMDTELRMEAAGVLADSREPGALPLLSHFFEHQIDPEVRLTLVTLLATSPQPEAAEYLIAVLGDAPEKLARHIVEALAKSRYAEAYERALAIMDEKHR